MLQHYTIMGGSGVLSRKNLFVLFTEKTLVTFQSSTLSIYAIPRIVDHIQILPSMPLPMPTREKYSSTTLLTCANSFYTASSWKKLCCLSVQHKYSYDAIRAVRTTTHCSYLDATHYISMGLNTFCLHRYT